ncbi:MAG: DUF885 domain-containing protein [Luteimonas sp.]
MSDQYLALALRILADAWDEQRQSSPLLELQLGGVLSRLPDLSLEGAQRNSAAAQGLLQRINALSDAPLPHPLALALRQARYRLEGAARQADWYWTVLDPNGVGFFGLYAPAAYCGGIVLNGVLQAAQLFRFEHAGDLDRYLGLVADYARMVEQITERTAGQAARGMRMPRPQLPAARALLAAFKPRARAVLGAAVARLPASLAAQAGAFSAELERRIAALVDAAFDRCAALLGAEYEALAPTAVGMAQYEGGAAIYAELVKRHTTLELTPEQIHQRGLERLAQVQAAMRKIRADADAGLADDPAGYLGRAARDPRFSATTTTGVAAVFQRYIDRMEPVFDRVFAQRPRAAYGVAALPEALQSSMTFGYYDPPKTDDPVGRFMFNSGNLTRQPLLNIASLTYHELVPGHHLHLSLQNENDGLHPVGRFAFCNAYNEAWAEYAATLAGELGLYEAAEERYGRLIMDAFLTSRLVVDTGMNALGWTLEQGRDYLRANASLAEAEVLSESLRYSCDMPAQALAYKLGDVEILRLRETMRATLGSRFELRDFHAAVLGPGALPLPDLEWHLAHVTEARLAA